MRIFISQSSLPLSEALSRPVPSPHLVPARDSGPGLLHSPSQVVCRPQPALAILDLIAHEQVHAPRFLLLRLTRLAHVGHLLNNAPVVSG